MKDKKMENIEKLGSRLQNLHDELQSLNFFLASTCGEEEEQDYMNLFEKLEKVTFASSKEMDIKLLLLVYASIVEGLIGTVITKLEIMKN